MRIGTALNMKQRFTIAGTNKTCKSNLNGTHVFGDDRGFREYGGADFLS